MTKRRISFLALPLLLFLSSSHFALLPARSKQPQRTSGTLVPGPDLIVGDLSVLQQFGSSGSQVGLTVATTACNAGDQEVNWMPFPNTSHPVIAQNLYRMSGGPNNNDRFEQIGQSWLKHGVETFQENGCGFGCIESASIFHLGVGCSDTYDASFSANQNRIGSRAWVNPFTGAFPANANNHTGHTHTGTSHRIVVENNDLNNSSNAGATYYAEAQYITGDEYNWCQSHPGQCNMYNNTSYQRFNVTGAASSYIFSPVGPTVPMAPAIRAWTGATINAIEPAPGVDGGAFIAFKVTNPSAGVWHYEYALYNQNLDRGIQSFSLPLGCGITVSNTSFHAPPVHPGFANDGTAGNAGFSATPWAVNQTSGALSWSSQTLAQNQNANAIRWGTLYNFRFDSNRPPQVANAFIGFFKTGMPVIVGVQAPTPDTCSPFQIIGAFSRLTHGAAGNFDIDLPLSGEPGVECRNGGGDHTIMVTFNNSIVSGNANLTSGTGNIAGSPTFNGNTMVINLTGVADVQSIIVTLSGVTDNSAQVLPDTAVSINMLIGDTNGNKIITASDIAQAKGQSGLPVTTANFRTDINASGTVTASDVAEIKANAGHTVP